MESAKAASIAAAATKGDSILVLCESQHHIRTVSDAIMQHVPYAVRYVFTHNIRVGQGEVRFLSLMLPDGQRPSEFDKIVLDFAVELERPAESAHG